jgi:CheY-like chemotaxis protein
MQGVSPIPQDRGRGLVLVVEDDPLLRDLVGHFLREEGYGVTVASTLSAARQALRRTRFDLVLTDSLGPSGTQAPATRWRALDQIRDLAAGTPVVIVSGHRREVFADYAARGFRDMLLKPFSLRGLLTLVARYIASVDP